MASTDPQRPNVVFVLSDDQGPWALGCAGNNEIRTPVLDALAARGTRLARFFCASPVCSPARASLLTGLPPSAHGVHDYLSGGHAGPDGVDLLACRTTVTDVLADNGYRMGLSGKWHLGANDRPRRGFAHWYAHEAGGSPYRGAPMYRDGRRVEEPGYLTDVIAEDASAFIGRESGRPEPFFLSVNFTAPHSPWAGQHPAEYERLYRDCAFTSCPQGPPHPWTTLSGGVPLGGEPDARAALVGYFAAVSAMDAAVGRVLAALDRSGLTESTVVIYSSDNGFNAGHHGIWGKGNGTWPLNLYDSSVMVPAIVSQPGRVHSGAVRDELLSAYDVAATILDLVGLDPDALEPGPGRSFAPLLTGDGTADRADRVVVFDEYGPTRMIRTERWKYVERWSSGPDELYDLAADPGETANLAGHPDHAGRVADLSAELADWFATHVTPELDGQRLPVIGTGQSGPLDAPAPFQGPLWDAVAGNDRG